MKLYLFFLFLIITVVYSIPNCNNFSPQALHTLKGTDWVPIRYTNGACYFHNKRTKKDTGELPLRKHLKKLKKLRL